MRVFFVRTETVRIRGELLAEWADRMGCRSIEWTCSPTPTETSSDSTSLSPEELSSNMFGETVEISELEAKVEIIL